MTRELADWLGYYRELGFTHLYRKKAEAQIHSAPGLGTQMPQMAQPSAKSAQPVPAGRGSADAVRLAPSAILPPAAQPENLFAAVAPRETLEAIRADLGDCQRCKLWRGRKSIVFGSGN